MTNIFSYIHIPFCELKCKYCRFASLWVSQDSKIDIYVNKLILEIKKSSFKKRILNSIYFWGWTPSVLKKHHLEKIINTLKDKYDFSNNIEITLESTPNNVTKDNLEIWNNIWINRLSLWIQTLNKKALDEINRWNKWDIELALENIKNYSKIDNISLDFIIWLPYVYNGEILENIRYILEQYDFVKHISVYMLEEYYNPDKIVETKYDKVTYPSDWKKIWLEEKEYLKEYSDIKKYLLNNWFNNYEISNFWLDNYECKHNKSYWKHSEVHAFWLWASWLNIDEKGDYIRYMNSDNFEWYYSWEKVFEDKMSESDLFIEKVMFGLRTTWLEKDIYDNLDQEKLNYFIKNWYLKKESEKIGLTDSWVLVLDHILSEVI